MIKVTTKHHPCDLLCSNAVITVKQSSSEHCVKQDFTSAVHSSKRKLLPFASQSEQQKCLISGSAQLFLKTLDVILFSQTEEKRFTPGPVRWIFRSFLVNLSLFSCSAPQLQTEKVFLRPTTGWEFVAGLLSHFRTGFKGLQCETLSDRSYLTHSITVCVCSKAENYSKNQKGSLLSAPCILMLTWCTV